eukprot:scaffold2831_cov249-Ochromonas_danica.AAC.17
MKAKTMSWTTAQFIKFHGARIRPALDLMRRSVEMIADPLEIQSILDLGCGPGYGTPFLCSSFPNATVESIDRFERFIQRAKALHEKTEYGNRVTFELVDSLEERIDKYDKKYDLVFCSSSLHRCENHEVLLPKIIRNLVIPNGGILAIQMPDTRKQPSHLLMETAALRTGLINHLTDVRIPRVEKDAQWYYSLLAPLVKDIDLWCTDYIHQLETTYDQEMAADNHPVLELTKSTGLNHVIDALGGEHSEKCQRYLREFNRLLQDQYPSVSIKNKYHLQGKLVTLMPFKRFFLVCRT